MTIELFLEGLLDNKIDRKFNFSNCSNSEYINGNIDAIVVLSLIFVALVFGTIGLIIKRKQLNK